MSVQMHENAWTCEVFGRQQELTSEASTYLCSNRIVFVGP
jgi:hypothetical protein